MQNKNKAAAVALAAIMLASAASACSNKNDSAGKESASAPAASPDASVTDPLGKYAEPVVMTIGRSNLPATNLPSPDTMEDNQFLKFIQDKLNVQIKYDWLADPNNAAQKINATIASGDLPDVMILNNQSQLKQLVESGLVTDLTDAFNQTLDPYLKGLFDSYQDLATTTAEFDGKLMAVPDLNPGYQFSLLWVRKDWMDKVGASAPKTLEDVVNLAQTFVSQDPGGNGSGKTVGMALSSWVAGNYNSFPSMDPVFGYYKAFPRQWLKDASGNIAYGSIQPEAKQALQTVSEWYKDGLLDKEFAVRKADDVNALISSGKTGIYFAPWWTPYSPLPDSLTNDPNADWEPFLAPLDPDGKYNVYNQNPHGSWIVVRKGYEHPEAVMKVLNLENNGIKKLDPEAAAIYEGLNVNWGVWPLNMQFDYNDNFVRQFNDLKAALDSKDSSKLTQEELGFYNNILKNDANPKQDIAAWSDATSRFKGEQAMAAPDKVNIVDNVFPGQTKSMDTKWANLEKLENETYLKIILGEAPIDSFDNFVKQWKAQGGDEITQEVNDAMKAQ